MVVVDNSTTKNLLLEVHHILVVLLLRGALARVSSASPSLPRFFLGAAAASRTSLISPAVRFLRDSASTALLRRITLFVRRRMRLLSE